MAPDGDVVILGRTDHQIKLRGLRIELGEIENVMLRVDGIDKVVIMIRKIGGKEHLCAYYTADREIAPDALKAEISKSLTQYMVPTAYRQLDKMPMTPNGKTDVKALPEPDLAVTSAYEAPLTTPSAPSARYLPTSCKWTRWALPTISSNWAAHRWS